MSCLYILDINPLLVISFANIFSHSVGCFFILLMVSFAVQKLLSLIRSHLFIFAFISFALGDRSKKILLREYPGGLVVRILGFHCHDLGSTPSQGTEIPQAAWYGQNKKQTNKQKLLQFMSKTVLPMFPSKSFMVSGLTFRSLIHFEFIFAYDAR